MSFWKEIGKGASKIFGEPVKALTRPIDKLTGGDLTSEVGRSIIPIGAGALGFALGGPVGAALGAGGTRALAGMSAGNEAERIFKNALFSGGLGYGAGAGLEALGYGAGSTATSTLPEEALLGPGYGYGAGGSAGGVTLLSSSSLPEIAGGTTIFGTAIPAGQNVLAATAAPEAAGMGIGTKLLLGTAGLGLADYFTTASQIGKQNEATQKALEGYRTAQTGAYDKYLTEHKAATEWAPEDRSGMMRAIEGIFSQTMEAEKKKAAAEAAARGTGGGTLEKRTKEIERKGREAVARILANTYGPSGQPPAAMNVDFSPYLMEAQAGSRSAGAETLQDLLGLGGQGLSLWALSKMFA